MLYCPILFETDRQKHHTVPIFALETLRRLVFLSFLGQHSVFACLDPNTVLSTPGGAEVLYSPNLSGSEKQKLRPSKYCFFWGFFGDSTAFLLL